ncbi:MAG: phage/plasmid primase, P4 family [Peptococcaceae bacterium]
MVIPEELRQLKQWVCWNGIADPTRPGKIKKIPVNARTGGNAQSNNPDTWCDYDTAVQASCQYSGIGFMFANGYFGIDIDDAEEDIRQFRSGDNDNIVAEFIYSLESYAEYSQSGKGIHIICKGILPEGGRRKGKVEMYQDGRFFIMTGKPAAEYAGITECTEAIKPLHAKYIGTNAPAGYQAAEVQPLDLDEQQIIEIALKSKQGQAFQTLFHGFWQGLYKSQSDADLAFCNMLAFWCGKDMVKMDNIFRKSGLMRDKWNRKTGGSTYGQITLNKAVVGCQEVFAPGCVQDSYSLSIGEQEKPVKLYSFDDTGNAERFTDHYRTIVRYSFIDKCWYYYNGKKWQRDFTGEVEKLIDRLLGELKREADFYAEDEDQTKAFNKHVKYSRSNKGKTALKKEVQHNVSILPQEFDRDIWQINVQNGMLNLQSGSLAEHNSDQFLSKVTNTEYSDKMDCPQWRVFLEQIFDHDQEMIRYIQKAVGYSLTGSTQEQCMFFCVGNGRNGKSTFLDTISDILGDYACNIQPETIMVKPYNGTANSDIARLRGARFVTTVEPNEGCRLNEGLIKQLTGGDKVTARFQYGHEFEYTPEFKIWMGTNHKPIIRGRDEGIWRRLHLIPFHVQIPENEVDKTLKYKLKREYMAILNWAVEGALLWQREGLKKPKAVAAAVNEYKSEMDVVAIFLEECTERGPGDVRAAELYQVYREWAKENGQYVMSSTKFGLEISKRYNKHKNGSGCMVYMGLRVINEWKPYSLSFGG